MKNQKLCIAYELINIRTRSQLSDGTKAMIAIAAIVLAQLAAPVSASASGNLSETLYWASTDATGSRLCDRKRSARYTEQFNRRYGARIQTLTQYHVGRFGPDPVFVITTSCRGSDRSNRQQDHDHQLAMNRFEGMLHGLEQQFGPGGKA